jgi:hypothetical protein
MKLIKAIVLAVLILPNLFYILINKRLFSSDDATYGKASIDLYLTLINQPLEWFIKIFTVHGWRPPLPYIIGEFFVPLGHALGSINLGFLLSVLILSFLCLWSLWNIVQKLYGNPYISFVGCLAMASTPLFMAQSRIFMLEIPQMLLVLWFIHLMIAAKEEDKISLGLKLLLGFSLCFLLKIPTFIFCLVPSIIILTALLEKRTVKSKWQQNKHAFLAAAAAVCLIYAFTWHIYNGKAELDYILLCINSNEIPQPYHLRLIYWAKNIQEGFFLWPLLIALVLSFIAALRKTKSQIFFVCITQITLIIFIFSTSTAGDHRFILPILPYFILLICWSLVANNQRILTSLLSSLFVAQFIFLQMFSFNLFESTRTSFFSQQVSSFQITGRLRSVNKNPAKLEKKIVRMLRLIKKLGKSGKPVALNVHIKSRVYLYYARCKVFPKVFDDKWIISFDDYKATESRISDRLIALKPAYCVIKPRGKSKYVTGLIKKSGMYRRIKIAGYPALKIYERIDLPNKLQI